MSRKSLKIILFSMLVVWMAVGIAAIWGKGGYKDIKVARQKAFEIRKDVDRLEAEIRDLKTQVEQLESSPYVYEVHAREKLLMKKPGEIVIYLPPEQKEEEGKKQGH
ncbi:MAG TPA: septum formation initiator family protein [Acidobacteriota bacterium]|nr:septum formation initiator family protein [Acidobacteriota bacterium]HNT17354.1 septum formation initiator family protein [Acidobacteriota bacterium]HQQ46430.1 septum formation initiator family protein [Acidobacteriota bacterium]